MRKFFINTHKSILLFSILALSCFSSNSEELTIDVPTPSEQIDIDSTLQTYDSSITALNNQFNNINEQIQRNSSLIMAIKDSIKIFQQIDISGNTSDKDIINSLIRIQSKLNLIEEKIFYSDSLYFNLLNDLVLIESQIEDLSQNINNITNLSLVIEETERGSHTNKIENYKQSYDSAVEYYMNKEQCC